MNTSSGRRNKALAFRAALLLAGGACFPSQAAATATAAHSSQAWIIYAASALVFLLAFAAAWRGMRLWRARVLRERDDEIMHLMTQWTKSLQLEVAERKEAQRALQESQALTLRQERLAAVGQLAAGLAHEFNNILTIIQGHASLLLDNPTMDEEAIKSLNHITDGVDRTAGLVKQMLAFSRQQVMQQKVLEIKSTMADIADMLHRLLGTSVVLNFDIAPQLPPIMADPNMLQQIIVNLVANARDAMSSGGHLTIRASEVKFAPLDLASKPERRTGRYIQLSVSDTGAGIESDVINHIFEPFFTTKDIGKGTGLGLATVYGMVNQNAGWIEVESKVGRGTTFNIYFPVAENTPKKTEAKLVAPMPEGGGETILVVEDEEVLRELVKDILEGDGYEVLTAASGREALEVWSRHGKSVDLLLTDMTMPDGISGRDLAGKLLEENPRLPVIYSSGFSHENLDPQDLPEGQMLFPKPYEPADLSRAVRAILDNAASREASFASSNI